MLSRRPHGIAITESTENTADMRRWEVDGRKCSPQPQPFVSCLYLVVVWSNLHFNTYPSWWRSRSPSGKNQQGNPETEDPMAPTLALHEIHGSQEGLPLPGWVGRRLAWHSPTDPGQTNDTAFTDCVGVWWRYLESSCCRIALICNP